MTCLVLVYLASHELDRQKPKRDNLQYLGYPTERHEHIGKLLRPSNDYIKMTRTFLAHSQSVKTLRYLLVVQEKRRCGGG